MRDFIKEDFKICDIFEAKAIHKFGIESSKNLASFEILLLGLGHGRIDSASRTSTGFGAS